MEKIRLPGKNVACKCENAFVEPKRRWQGQKRVNQEKTTIAKAKTRIPIGNVARKGETVFSEQTVARKGENTLTERKCRPKGENAVSELKRRSQRRKSFQPSKTSLTNAKTHLTRENGAHKDRLSSGNVAR